MSDLFGHWCPERARYTQSWINELRQLLHPIFSVTLVLVDGAFLSSNLGTQ